MHLNDPGGHTIGRTGFPGRPPAWQGPLVEVDRLETHDTSQILALLDSLGLDRLHEPGEADTGEELAVGLLLGARACAELGGVPGPAPSPVDVPECVAVVYRRGARPSEPHPRGAEVGEWRSTWTDAEHAAAVERVRDAIARGDVYQANVVGHRAAPFAGDPLALAVALGSLPGARYGGWVAGDDWLVASASPEQLVRVEGGRICTTPIKGTARERDALLLSAKDQAEHVMIVDLERNDLARVTRAGSVVVDDLYALAPWSDLWHASSRVTGELLPGTRVGDVLRAVAPGGSVTGAPKHAACGLLASLEPVGRGPAMGAFGFVWAGGLELGLTIRTVAAAGDEVHLWAGGGITWGSDPATEVAEAHAKAAPVQQALAQVRPSSS